MTMTMASETREKMRRVLVQLDPSLPSANIYPALVAIRTRSVRSMLRRSTNVST